MDEFFAFKSKKKMSLHYMRINIAQQNAALHNVHIEVDKKGKTN